MSPFSSEFDLAQMAPAILASLRASVTVFDLEGRMLYFNEHAPLILDRKPEHLGRDIQLCHSQPHSTQKFQKILDTFRSGQRKEFYYVITRNQKKLAVKVAPLLQDGQVVGGVHAVMLLGPSPEK